MTVMIVEGIALLVALMLLIPLFVPGVRRDPPRTLEDASEIASAMRLRRWDVA